MLSQQQLENFFRLQRSVLDSEDTANLTENLISQVALGLCSTDNNYVSLGIIFTDSNNVITKSFFCDFPQNPAEAPLCRSTLDGENFLNAKTLFDKNNKWEKEMTWGNTFIETDIKPLLASQLPEYLQIKSLIISPIVEIKKLAGAFILATKKEKSQIVVDDLAYLSLVTNLISSTYRLQDTQSSLTNISQEVYKMNAKLHDLDKLKDDFVSVASHELRTPMTAIRSYAWMALNRADIPLSEKMKRYLNRTLISTERLINLVNDMLNISRIESGRIEIVPKAFDIEDLVTEVLTEVEVKAREKNLHLNLQRIVLPQVYADPDKVHQVLLNLLGNAMKFTPQDGLINISFLADGEKVEVAVKDSGVGINKEDLSGLFKKFGRLDNSYVAAATSGGTGLGLFICKSLVELMGGKIWAASDGLNKGTTFTFSLPVASPKNIADSDKYTLKPKGDVTVLEPVAI